MAKKKAKAKRTNCKCVDLVNEALEESGAKLETSLQLDMKSGKATVVGPLLSV